MKTYYPTDLAQQQLSDLVAEHGLSHVLECLVDNHSLQMVILQLSEIASGKADHLQSNWQDSISAKRFEKVAQKLSDLGNCKL